MRWPRLLAMLAEDTVRSQEPVVGLVSEVEKHACRCLYLCVPLCATFEEELWMSDSRGPLSGCMLSLWRDGTRGREG